MVDILTFDGFFGAKFDILKPRWLPTAIMMPLHSISVGMAFPAVAATTQDVVPPKLRGLSWGMALVCLFVLGGAWGPLLVGAVSDDFGGGYRGLALGLALAAMFGFVASWLWFMTERYVEVDTRRAKGTHLVSERCIPRGAGCVWAGITPDAHQVGFLFDVDGTPVDSAVRSPPAAGLRQSRST